MIGGEMLGFIAGVFIGLSYIGISVDHDWATSAPILALEALGITVAGIVVGLVLRMTVGIAAMWAMVGAFIGAVIEFVHGASGYGFALLLHAVAFWAIGQVLGRLTYGNSAVTAVPASSEPFGWTPAPSDGLEGLTDEWWKAKQPDHTDVLEATPSTRQPAQRETHADKRWVREWKSVGSLLEHDEEAIDYAFLLCPQLGKLKRGTLYTTSKRLLWRSYAPGTQSDGEGFAIPLQLIKRVSEEPNQQRTSFRVDVERPTGDVESYVFAAAGKSEVLRRRVQIIRTSLEHAIADRGVNG